MPTRVEVLEETCTKNKKGEWNLCFQWCKYNYKDGPPEHGYRFIWRRPNGNLQPARGQARIPNIKTLEELVKNAKDQGWGHLSD